jgi:cytoskeletal protein CcmA (bactofilin family)
MGNKVRDRDADIEIRTTLGKETVFLGTLKFTESLKIDGRFEGEIDATGFLFISPEAEVKASSIRATSIIVGGTVYGDMEASEKLELLPSAKVVGNVKTSRLRIADGVIFEGQCEMIRSVLPADIFSGSVEEIKDSMRRRSE